MHNFIAPLGKILRAVVKNLGAIVRGSLRPRCRLPRRLDRVADVFAIAERSLTQQSSVGRTHFDVVAGVWTRLLATDVELDRAIDFGRTRLLMERRASPPGLVILDGRGRPPLHA